MESIFNPIGCDTNNRNYDSRCNCQLLSYISSYSYGYSYSSDSLDLCKDCQRFEKIRKYGLNIPFCISNELNIYLIFIFSPESNV